MGHHSTTLSINIIISLPRNTRYGGGIGLSLKLILEHGVTTYVVYKKRSYLCGRDKRNEVLSITIKLHDFFLIFYLYSKVI